MRFEGGENISVDVTDDRGARPNRSSISLQKAWLAVSVKVHQEQKMSEKLSTYGIESFVAIQQEYRQWSDRLKLVNHVVLPMIVFVHVTSVQRQQVLKMSSAVRYIIACGQHCPAVIPDGQMETFKFMLDYSPEIVNVVNIPMKRGKKVRIIKGPLAGIKGEVVIVGKGRKVGICLDALGYACVKVPVGYLELI